jgi:polysaccharide biosynthesis PFTS motif protein
MVDEDIADLVKIYGNRNDSLDFQMKINTCLSYDMMLAMQVNIKAVLSRATGRKSPYLLPWRLARKLGCGIFFATISHIWFNLWLIVTSSVKSARVLFYVAANMVKRCDKIGSSSDAYLFSAMLGNFKPADITEPCDYVLETWLEKNLLGENCSIAHSNKHLKERILPQHNYLNNFLPSLNFRKSCLIFVAFPYLFFGSFLSSLLGQWHKLFLLHELLARQVFAYAEKSSLQSLYLYPFQGTQARPLWADIAESKGAAVMQLNYASYMLPELGKGPVDHLHYDVSPWSHIIPFNARVAKFLDNHVPAGTTIVRAPSVSFADRPKNILPVFKKPVIALFDIAVLDPSKFVGINPVNDYLYANSEDGLNFHRSLFADVRKVARRFGCVVAYKQKRQDSRLDQGYVELCEEFCDNEDVFFVDPEISAYRLVDSSRFAIVQPFSSVGLYESKAADICFYDPLEVLRDGHPSALAGDLCIGSENLNSWFETRLGEYERAR